MKCQSCQVTIDPKWKNAIEKNECPFCGDVIMDVVLKDLLTEAKELFTELMKEEYKSSFVDWIRANYSFVLTNQKLTQAEESILVKTKETSILDEMYKRAQVKEVPKEERLTNAISKLSGAGSVSFETDEPPLDNYELGNISSAVNKGLGFSDDPDAEEIPATVLMMANLAKNKPADYNAKDIMRLQDSLAKASEAKERISSGAGAFRRG